MLRMNLKRQKPGIVYNLKMSEPWTHYLDVEIEISDFEGRWADFVMPAWTPGSYKIRDYAQHLQEFSALSRKGYLPFRKTDKQTWRVDAQGVSSFTVRYRLYANELTVRTNYVDDSHAFVSPAGTFLFLKGYDSLPVELKVFPYKNWKVATGLNQKPGSRFGFQALNYDELIDCPLEIGKFELHTFQFKGKSHRVAINGSHDLPVNRFIGDLRKIVAEISAMFGDLPYKHYTFIINFHHQGGGGLEHRNSQAVQGGHYGWQEEDKYEKFISLISHEFFHTWNVKRIKPEPFMRYELEKEQYTPMLWVSEGFTTYYEDLILRRAGLFSPKRYLSSLTAMIKRLQDAPGRQVMSVSESSFDAWIKLYNANENAQNSMISYYTKGALVGLLLDLSIRRDSKGVKSLDDLMRALYKNYWLKGFGFPADSIRDIAESLTGKSYGAFFRDFVLGVKELPYNKYLGSFGLNLQMEAETVKDFKKPKRTAGLDCNYEEKTGALKLSSLTLGGAASKAGLSAGDEIVAINGYRMNKERFGKFLDNAKPGDKARFILFRGEHLRRIDVILGEKKNSNPLIVVKSKANATAKKFCKDWLCLKKFEELNV